MTNVLQAVNDRAVVPVVARTLALGVRAQSRLTLKTRSRAGVSESIWTILTVAGVAAIAAVVLFPLVSQILSMGTAALGKVSGAPW